MLAESTNMYSLDINEAFKECAILIIGITESSRTFQDEGIREMKTDLVNHSHINLQNVRDVYCGRSRCLKCQTKVMYHHFHLPWDDGRNLGTHMIQLSGLD